MNKKIITTGLLSIVMLAGAASPTMAFWPFDGLFEKGEVKSITTDDGRIAKMPKDRQPVRSTAREIAALRAACKNIIDFDKPQQKKYENTAGKGNNEGGVSLEETALDKSIMSEYTGIRKMLVVKCNEILSLTSKIDPILKKNENAPVRVIKQATPPARIREGLLQKFLEK